MLSKVARISKFNFLPSFKIVTNGKVPHTQLFINNEFVNSVKGETFETVNPATEEIICSVQKAGQEDVEKAVKFAQNAFEGEWRKMSAHKRGELIYKLGLKMEENFDELVALESLDSGKPVGFASAADIPLAIQCFKYYGGLASKITGDTLPVEGPYTVYTRREPVGVAGQIIPWNFPILMLAWKWGPALAAGAVSILKTSEKTPLSALRIAHYAKEVGFPPGVVQVLSGYGDVGEALVRHPGVDKIAFTGSTRVGIKISQLAASANMKRVTLELGGKSPNIICHDADVKKAAQIAKFGLFMNQGQCCIAGSRVYVHEKIYDQFLEAMVNEVKSIKVGDPRDTMTEQGPQVDEIQFKSVMSYIQKGKDEGARLLYGGERMHKKGYFIQPTIFADVQDSHTISKEEIFGPVISIKKFSDYDEVIKRANDTQYGLGAGVVTNDIGIYQKLANSIRAGTVYVNCYDVFDANTPFGGFKASGIGRELGPHAVDNYLENKTIILAQQEGTLP